MIFTILLAIYFIIVHLLISNTAAERPKENADYIIILGARLHGERMSLSLYYRALEALEYVEGNQNTIIIASGGQGPGEDITEAEAIKRFMLEHGIEQERIILEDTSTTTYENLMNSYSFIEDDNKTVVIVSNDFHLFRAKMIAERVGFNNISTLSAETPKVAKVKLWFREYFAVLKSWLIDR
ncbi:MULTISPECIES: YdcF family protein [Sutcliffiella]|nr:MULTISPECIES: YdcF family protein [Sutcliffiella]MED4014877.1 YdcF family protein [Sutcliffiella cohnii]WBL17382.1 YdcF family protein [Sutcliffiella sp. NC1]